MKAHRGFVVLGLGALLILVPFLSFVTLGWPGQADGCVHNGFDTCFCEHFEPADVLRNAAGVRQPVNTWFNLYSLITASIVALRVYFDRKRLGSKPAPNLMRSWTLMPDIYIFVVLFRGLGSMWFHASLTRWGGLLDGLAMYMYGAFLVFYSVRRLWVNALFFWIAYPGTIVVFMLLHIYFPSGALVFTLVLSLYLAYLIVEIAIWIHTEKVMMQRASAIVLWAGAVLAIILATMFWVLSQSGGPMCSPRSVFQPHGLLWHPLVGLMGVLLYFYWREAEDSSGVSGRPR